MIVKNSPVGAGDFLFLVIFPLYFLLRKVITYLFERYFFKFSVTRPRYLKNIHNQVGGGKFVNFFFYFAGRKIFLSGLSPTQSHFFYQIDIFG